MGSALQIHPSVGTALMEVMKVCHKVVVDLRRPETKPSLEVYKDRQLYSLESHGHIS